MTRSPHNRLFIAITGGNPNFIRLLVNEFDADPNHRDPKGRTCLMRAVRGHIVEISVVQALLDGGADPKLTDPEGLTVLDHARTRLATYEGKPRKLPRRSPSLTPHGDIKLRPLEHKALDRMHETNPDIAEEFEADYLQARREAAERVFDTRGNLEKIVSLLEARG